VTLLDKQLTSVGKYVVCIAISRAVRGVTDDSRVQTMKKKIPKEIDSRLADIMKEPLYATASLLDL